jgi:hypothetical protein
VESEAGGAPAIGSNTTAISGIIVFSLCDLEGELKPLNIFHRQLILLVNTTSPLNAVQFAAASGNLTGGSIRLYVR